MASLGDELTSLYASQGPQTGGKVPITDRQDVKKHQITLDTFQVLSCLRGLQQATLAQCFKANDVDVVRAALHESLLTTVDQCLSKFDVGSRRSEDVQSTVLECLPRYHKAKLLEGFYTMQQKQAKQLGCSFTVSTTSWSQQRQCRCP